MTRLTLKSGGEERDLLGIARFVITQEANVEGSYNMQEVRDLLTKPLEANNGHILREQLSEVEAQSAYVSQLYRKAEEDLADLRGKVYDPSLRTELERKVAMERVCRNLQREVDELADLAKLISNRVSLGQSFLRDMQAEIQGQLR